MKPFFRCLILLVILGVPGGDAWGLAIVWTNTAGGNWNIIANWSPNQLPTAADDVFITNNGTYTVTLNVSSTNGTLTLGGTSGTQTLTNSGQTLTLNGACASSANGIVSMGGGTITGNGSFTLAGPFNWSGGSIGSAASSFVLTARGSLSISGGSKNFTAGTIINSGAATWSAGGIICSAGTLFSNTPSGTFDLQADGNAFTTSGTGQIFANAGTLRKAAGSGTSTISVPCSNSGLVRVNSGSLALALANGSGEFTAAAGTTLSINGTATLSGSASIDGTGNFTVTAGAITNNGAFKIQGTNTINGGNFALTGDYLDTNGVLVVNSGSVTFSGTGTLAFTSMALSGGSIFGSMTVPVLGPSTWTGGNIGNASSSSLVVMANGGLAISGATGRFFGGGILVNGGTSTWSGGTITCSSGTLFSNATSATFDLQADGNAFATSGNNQLFVNAGTLRKSAGSGTSTIAVPCANAGAVLVNSGTLALTLASGSGEFTVSSGATLSAAGTSVLSGNASIDGPGNFTFTGGNVTNNGAFKIQGTNTINNGNLALTGDYLDTNGVLVVNSGSVTFSGTGTLAFTSMALSGGSLYGSMTVPVLGPSTWTGGNIGNASSGSLVVMANGGLAISGTTGRFLGGGTLVNGGTVTWTGGTITCSSGTIFSNASSATFDLQADGTAFATSGTGQIFANAGTLRKSSGSGTSTVSVPCANSGTVLVNSGTLALTLTDGSGEFTTAAGTALSVNGTATLSGSASIDGPGNFTVTSGAITNNGAFQIQGTNAFSGGNISLNGNCLVTNGPILVNNGTVAFNGTGTIAPASLTISSGALAGSMTVAVSGPFIWSGGNIGNNSSQLVILANGGLALSGSSRFLNGGTLVNAGTATYSAGTINCYPGSILSNAPAATFDLQADGTAFSSVGGGGLLLNAGIFRKSAGSGTSAIAIPISNSGTIQANTGTLSFSVSYIQSGGQTLLNGGNFTFSQTAMLRGGTLSGTGAITGSVSNNAIISPGGSPGLLSISGNYSEGPAANLQIELGNGVAGIGYDQLSVGGSAALAGTLTLSYLNGFTPAPGNVFTTMVYNVHSGGYVSVQAPTNNLSTVYTGRNLLVEPGNVSPNAQLSVGLVQLAGHTFRITGSGTDPDGSVTNLTLYQDTNVLASSNGPSASTTIASDFPGQLVFTAQATDNHGAQGITNIAVTITNLPLLTLDPIGFQSNRSFKFLMLGVTDSNYQIQAKTDLNSVTWTNLGAMENTNGIWRYFDTSASNNPRRIYRAGQSP